MEKLVLGSWELDYCGKTYPASVPGDVLIDLYKNGVVEDPYYAENLHVARQYLEDVCTYRTKFDASHTGKCVELVFDGIDTYSEIYLNGRLLGKTENMFLQYRFSVTNILKEKDNVLEVRMLPHSRYIDEEYHGRGVFNTKRLQLRKAQCHFGWDWAPDLSGYGIWLPVYVEIHEECLRDVWLVPSNDGNVKVYAEVEGNGVLEIFVDKELYGAFPVTNGKNELAFTVKNAKLWWPNGYGAQPLYDYEIHYIVNEKAVDTKTGTFAFREITILEEDVGEGRTGFGFAVNGKRIFAQGSNWVPCSNQTGAIPDEEYETLLHYAQQAGYTMLRNWGGGIYEKEIFYNLCDRYGILVWQDMMFACQDAPQGVNIEERIKPELEYQLKRIRKHPCVAIICGGNEWSADNGTGNDGVISLLEEYSHRLIPKLRFIPNSPFGKDTLELSNRTSGDTHISCLDKCFDNDNFRDFRKYIDNNRAQFYSECTSIGCSRVRSLKKFIPEDKLWPINDVWETHFVKNPFIPNPELTFVRREERLCKEFFGEATSVTDFAKKSMVTQGEMIEAEAEYARMNKHCYGFMNWMFNDNWGCGTWALIDKYLEPKAAYYYLKRAYKLLSVRYVYQNGGLGLFISNDSTEDFIGGFEYGIKNFDGTIIQSQSAILHVYAGEVVRLDPILGKGDYLYANLGEGKDKTIFYLKPFAKRSWTTDVTLLFVEVKENGIVVKIKANTFARCVFIDYPKSLLCSDNYFDLEQGEEREVLLEGLREEDFESVSVKTFADEWTE